MKTRAERRHHNERVKHKFYKSLLQMDWYDKEDAIHRAHFYDTRHPCSCYMCGNPRKAWKDKTMQEKKFEEININHEIIAVSSNGRIVGS